MKTSKTITGFFWLSALLFATAILLLFCSSARAQLLTPKAMDTFVATPTNVTILRRMELRAGTNFWFYETRAISSGPFYPSVYVTNYAPKLPTELSITWKVPGTVLAITNLGSTNWVPVTLPITCTVLPSDMGRVKFYKVPASVPESPGLRTIRLEWNYGDPSVTRFRVYGGLQSRAYTGFLKVTNAHTMTLTSLVPGTTYYVAVVAEDDMGFASEFSNEIVYTAPHNSALFPIEVHKTIQP